MRTLIKICKLKKSTKNVTKFVFVLYKKTNKNRGTSIGLQMPLKRAEQKFYLSLGRFKDL